MLADQLWNAVITVISQYAAQLVATAVLAALGAVRIWVQNKAAAAAVLAQEKLGLPNHMKKLEAVAYVRSIHGFWRPSSSRASSLVEKHVRRLPPSNHSNV